MKIHDSNLLKILVVSLLFITGISQHSHAQKHILATYNIRMDSRGDIGNLWEDRAPHIVNLIQFHGIEIVGIQEAFLHQLQGLTSALGYAYLGVGRDDGKEKGEHTAILYDPTKFKLLKNGTFWLSPTPEKPSKGWDAALNRICSWGKFEDQSGTEFYAFNVHYDHVGQKAREESSKLVLSKISEINQENAPVILMGDFNVSPDNLAYTLITSNSDWKDARLISKIPAYGPQGTFTAFDWDRMPDQIIDHLFVKGDVQVLRHGILSDNYGKKYPSDHFPVMIEVEF